MFKRITIFVFFGLICSPLLAQFNPFDSLPVVSTHRVHFEFGKYNITSEAGTILKNLVDTMNVQRARLYITAHTDSIGTEKSNLKLSSKRSDATKFVLTEMGVPSEQVFTHSYGENRPETSNRTEEGRRINRRSELAVHYKQKMVTVRGQVLDDSTGQGIKAQVLFHSKTAKDSLWTREDGRFQKDIAENAVVGLDIYADGYLYDSKMIKVSSKKLPKLEFRLPKLEIGQSFDLNNLYFVGNKALLMKRSVTDLARLHRFMAFNKGISVEIGGHVNHPNAPKDRKGSWYHSLSVRRAKLIYNYLIKKGIDELRLTYKGYANWKMRYPEASKEAEMRLNRRVEIKIISSGEVISKEVK
jgi:outer membrane protein OmpA-like peptidoglycan-associated protein